MLPLHSAVLAADADRIQLLLDQEYAIDEQDTFGNTALLLAMKMGLPACVRLLLGRGANLKARNAHGRDSFYYVQKVGNKIIRLRIVDCILEKADADLLKALMGS